MEKNKMRDDTQLKGEDYGRMDKPNWIYEKISYRI